MRREIAIAISLLVCGCGAPIVSGEGEEGSIGDVTPAPTPTPSDPDVGPSVNDYVGSSCSTQVVRPLSEQLILELNCLSPGAVSKIPEHPRIDVTGIFDYLQTGAAESLPDVVAARPGATMDINSALRSLAQQYLLYRWYQQDRCGITLAASPGTSNHERGLAIDIADNAGWRDELQDRAWDWLGAGDPVHYDYGNGGVNLSGLSVLAFQRLWNLNHPEDLIAEDGEYGPQTATRLGKSPANGFAEGATCGETLTFAPVFN